MISRTVPLWQVELARAVSTPAELLRRLGLPDPGPGTSAPDFPVRVPEGYLARMRPGDPDDPLLRQVLAVPEEQVLTAGYRDDPVGDLEATEAPGLLRKYRGRALLVVTGACPVHCRYCFRRRYPYATGQVSPARWEGVLERLAADPTVSEVVLSGGDPLTVTDEKLRRLVEGLEGIPHLRRLRVHTRAPVVLPSRVDAGLLGWLADTRLPTVFVVHANHPNELGPEAARALGRLRDAGCTVLNQSVLLRGVNDRVEVLAEVSERLFAAGALPYYLHQLDRVQGAAHFEISDDRARSLVSALRARLPGYLVPRLVREEPGQPAKTVLL
jgi:EF-P beta-lysylation protein EpmB